jgi:hypothetical protein
MSYTLTVDISANSEGLVYTITDGNTYTSQGYKVGTSSTYTIASTTDIVNTTKYSSYIGFSGSTSSSNSPYLIKSNFYDSSSNYSNFYYYPIEDVSGATLECSKYNRSSRTTTTFPQKKMINDPEKVFTFYDASGNSNGKVDYDQTLNRFTATNDISSKYNYQNISIVANAGMSVYFYENGTGGSQSSEVNATYAMNASVFNKL